MQNSNDLLNIVIKALEEVTNDIIETKEMLLKKYPELFSLYTKK